MNESEGISQKVLNMKFMQRPKEEELKRKMLLEQQRKMNESHWVLREESTSVITLEESIMFDRFTPGRRSFKGFNKQIEAITRERQVEEAIQAKRVRNEEQKEEQEEEIISISNSSKKKKPSATPQQQTSLKRPPPHRHQQIALK